MYAKTISLGLKEISETGERRGLWFERRWTSYKAGCQRQEKRNIFELYINGDDSVWVLSMNEYWEQPAYKYGIGAKSDTAPFLSNRYFLLMNNLQKGICFNLNASRTLFVNGLAVYHH